MATTLICTITPPENETVLIPDINPKVTGFSLTSSAGMPCYPPYVITALSDNNEVVGLLFSKKTSLEWSQFKSSVAYHLRARDEDIEDLKGILGAEKGTVNASEFEKMLKWFSPLVPEADLRASGGFFGSSAISWRISSIAALVRQPWFHGFAPDVNKRLRSRPAGTFLIRFGCQAPHFILSLKDASVDAVVEWRVLCMSGSVRLVESERFMNLQQLVENYTNNVPAGASSQLQCACDRTNVYR